LKKAIQKDGSVYLQTVSDLAKIKICQDANLKFKTILRRMREKKGLTQEGLARDLGFSLSKYKRIENIGQNYQVTISQSAAIYRYFRIEEGFQEVLHFLEPSARQGIINRVNLTHNYLAKISSGEMTVKELQSTAKKLVEMYSSTSELVGLI